MTRLAFFVRSMSGGGAQRVMVRFASGFAAAGVETDVLTLDANGPFRDELAPGVRLLEAPANRLATAAPWIARYLKKVQPDSFMTTEPACNVIGIAANVLAGRKTRLTIREGLFPSVAARESIYRAERIAYRLAPFAYRYADAVIAIARPMADDLAQFARLPRSTINVIAVNPVVTAELIQAAAQPSGHRWFAPGSPPVITALGRLSPQKDFETLVRAFAKLRAERPARLLIIGEGPQRAALERLVRDLDCQDDVELFGFTANPYPLLADSAVFVLSSRYEGLPNSLIEALACGVPVVATDCPSGPADVLDGGRIAPLVPVGDVDAMAAAISKVLRSPPDRAALKSRGLDFTLQKSIEAYRPVLLPE